MKKKTDWVGYFCGAVTDIIFNREAGWSEKLENKITKILEEYNESILQEAQTKCHKYWYGTKHNWGEWSETGRWTRTIGFENIEVSNGLIQSRQCLDCKYIQQEKVIIN